MTERRDYLLVCTRAPVANLEVAYC